MCAHLSPRPTTLEVRQYEHSLNLLIWRRMVKRLSRRYGPILSDPHHSWIVGIADWGCTLTPSYYDAQP